MSENPENVVANYLAQLFKFPNSKNPEESKNHEETPKTEEKSKSFTDTEKKILDSQEAGRAYLATLKPEELQQIIMKLFTINSNLLVLSACISSKISTPTGELPKADRNIPFSRTETLFLKAIIRGAALKAEKIVMVHKPLGEMHSATSDLL
jgi:hypothetical protein